MALLQTVRSLASMWSCVGKGWTRQSVVWVLPGLLALVAPVVERSVVVAQEVTEDRKAEGDRLLQLGLEQSRIGQLQEARRFLEQAIEIYRELGNRWDEAAGLGNLGNLYVELGENQEVITVYEKVLDIARELNNFEGQVKALNGLGNAYRRLENYQQAIAYFEQSLAIAQDTGNLRGQAYAMGNLGNIHLDLEEYEDAITHYRQVLFLTREIGDERGQRITLKNLGDIYTYLEQYQFTIEFYEEALLLLQRSVDMTQRNSAREEEIDLLIKLGSSHRKLNEYKQSVERYQQALLIAHEVDNRNAEAIILGNLGVVYDNQSQYEQAIEYYQQALIIHREMSDQEGIVIVLGNLGNLYYGKGQYQKSLDHHQESFAVAQNVNDAEGQRNALLNLGLVYQALGQVQQAIHFYEQSLALSQDFLDKRTEISLSNNLGNAYYSLGDYQQALSLYERALKLAREINNRLGENRALGNLAGVHLRLGQLQHAISFYQEQLTITQAIEDRAGEGRALQNLGTIYHKQRQIPEALANYQRSLAIQKVIGNRHGEGIALSSIGILLAGQDEPELAILFLKESVKVFEEIRQDLRRLPKVQQQSFVDTVADTYRALADLLLQGNRVLEAQQILELLKIQELDDFLRNVRSAPDIEITVLRPERAILEEYGELQQSIIALNQEQSDIYKRLRETGALSEAEDERLSQIDAIFSDLSRHFQSFIHDPDVLKWIGDLSDKGAETEQQAILPEQLIELQDNLAALDAVMLYPLVLDDRIELVVTTPDSAPIQRTVRGVTRTELNEAITAFRLALDSPRSDAVIPAQQLYHWLIEPIEQDLAEAELDTIIYAPDGPLRYIPLAALHDGEKWLVERFQINHVTAASLSDLERADRNQPVVLAGAFADTSVTYDVAVGDRHLPFKGLPFAGEEVETLMETLPNIHAHFDQAFDLNALKPRIGAYNILHFATHAAFVPDYPVNSFILSGNGNPLSLQTLREQWNFSGIDLVVLSACETGLGGYDNNGEQILGLGYVFQDKGAKAVMASLWQVSDRGTQNADEHLLRRAAAGYI